MPYNFQAIEHREWDSDIFQVPFYRVKDPSHKNLGEEIDRISIQPRFMIDAKVPSDDLDSSALLKRKGFIKICTQAELCKIPLPSAAKTEYKIESVIMADDSLIRAHAKNFIYDRFSVDDRINKDSHDLLYERWIMNSFQNPIIRKLADDSGFCSFKEADDFLAIDLISVLNKGAGVGNLLVSKLNSYAVDAGVATIKVITELKNSKAFQFYLRNGFQVSRFYSCYHYVKN